MLLLWDERMLVALKKKRKTKKTMSLNFAHHRNWSEKDGQGKDKERMLPIARHPP